MSIESEFNEYVELIESLESLRDVMVSPADIQHGIGAIAGMAELLKKANEIAKKTNNLEIREIILSLQEQTIDTKALLVESKGRLVELEEENLKLRDKLRTREKLPDVEQDGGHLYIKGEKKPICPNCWRNKKEAIILSDNNGGLVEKFICKSCQYEITEDSRRWQK